MKKVTYVATVKLGSGAEAGFAVRATTEKEALEIAEHRANKLYNFVKNVTVRAL
jgi:hypothetical protein